MATELRTISATANTPLISQVSPATFQLGDGMIYTIGTIMGSLAIVTSALQTHSFNQVLPIFFETLSTVVLIYGLFKSTLLHKCLPCLCGQSRTYQYEPADGMLFLLGMITSIGAIALSAIQSSSLQVFCDSLEWCFYWLSPIWGL